jgi:hypothetical protein
MGMAQQTSVPVAANNASQLTVVSIFVAPSIICCEPRLDYDCLLL